MQEYLVEKEEVLSEYKTTKDGLSESEVSIRQEQFGKNKLKAAKKESIIEKFFSALVDPMVIVLIIAALISLVTAIYENESFADVIIIMLVVLINACLGVYQESKAEKAIEALQEMSKSMSKVLRDGKLMPIPSEDLVPGDVIIIEAGDSIPADARILECASLKIEEAALTGESVPVTKTDSTLQVEEGKEILLGDRKNMVYMGSNAVYGRGMAVVVGTGMNTEMGKIAEALTLAKEENTPLQKKLNQLSKILSILVLSICVIIFAIDLIRHRSDINSEMILNTFMVAVSLAVAAIPEGLAAVVTIVLSIGVTNMSKRNAIIRKLTAVETLGCTQIICSDKTGTLTQNKMTVVEQVSGDLKLLAISMALCNDAEIVDNETIGEPTEVALVNYATTLKLNKNDLKIEYKRIGEAPFDSMRKMMSTVHKDKDGNIIQFTKGALDEILKKCKYILEDGKEVLITDKHKEVILANNKKMATKALRVLSAAYKKLKYTPTTFEAQDLESDLVFIGIVGMIDPIRPEVKDAVANCKEAGIRVVMITGDHKDTAVAIASELGILHPGNQAITGAELNKLSESELIDNIENYAVYARVQPEHKVRIVNAWKSLGKITAMTGDGVNDAPSIKNADIGIGMGITGTDVTKNVADMVLADDNFATIVSAVGEGRRIYDNIRKSIQFLLSSNLAEVLAIFTATILGFTILKPVHLLWINLITDSFPAIALGMEPSEEDSTKQPPRDSKEGIFANKMGSDILIQGVVITALTLFAFIVGHRMEGNGWHFTDSDDGTTMAFLTLSLVEMFHSFNMRSRTKSIFGIKKQNKFLWIAFIASFIATTAVIYIPFLANAFEFEHISFLEYIVAVGIAFTIIPIMEGIKFVRRRTEKKAIN